MTDRVDLLLARLQTALTPRALRKSGVKRARGITNVPEVAPSGGPAI